MNDIKMTETDFDDFIKQNQIECWDFDVEDRNFLLLGCTTSKTIFFEKKVFIGEKGRCVWLHAIREYKSFEDALDNLDGELVFYHEENIDKNTEELDNDR